jgi:hypothetical protein
MSDVNWWMDANCRWHKGLPPPGWWQARNGRWHPPASDDTTTEMTIGPSAGAAHLAGGGRRANLVATYRSWPRWARLAAPISAFVLTIGVLAAAATGGLLDNDPETTATDETAPATDPSTTVAPATTGAPASTAASTHATTTVHLPSAPTPAEQDPVPTTSATTPAPEPPATTAPTNNDIHPGAPCSPEGATAISSDGIHLTCTRQKCHGAPFSEPRWRRTTC